MSDAPDFIEVYPGALDASFCEAVVRQFEASGLARPGAIGSGVDPTKKDSLDATITDYPEWRPVCERVFATTFRYLVEYCGKYSHLVTGALSPSIEDTATGRLRTVDHATFEELARPRLPGLVNALYRFSSINVQKYRRGSGGYHHWHSEAYPRDASGETLHRVLLFMYYLNDVADGGETEFFYQERKVRPATGSLIIAPAAFTHTHKGHVPLSGDKFLLASWVLFRRAEDLYGSVPPSG